eukprot:3056762-Rhodomonas_salina.1
MTQERQRNDKNMRQRHLPGHRKMLREINALLILLRQLHIARETAVKEGEAVWKPVRGDYNARMIKLAT